MHSGLDTIRYETFVERHAALNSPATESQLQAALPGLLMALLVASRSPVSQGQVTATIYGHLQEGRYDDAIHILEWELQVSPLINKISRHMHWEHALITDGVYCRTSLQAGPHCHCWHMPYFKLKTLRLRRHCRSCCSGPKTLGLSDAVHPPTF